MKKSNLLGRSLRELTEIAVSMGLEPFRGKQLYRQIYQRGAPGVEEMTDLSKSFREDLTRGFELRPLTLERRHRSADGTTKLLFRLEDDRFIESVFIPEERRETLCISSQVGCGVGCTFCRTALMGFQRNLSCGEILGQVFESIRNGSDWSPERRRGFNVVFMGMGEPLYNYRNVMKAFQIMTDPAGMGLSHRRITLSTSGVVPVLRRMTGESKLPNLAVSLNAPADPLRNELMPINRKWSLEELIQVCRDFPLEPRRRITFEYVLLAGVTDSRSQARELVSLLKGLRAKVNLIPFNPASGLPFERPSAEAVDRFQKTLREGAVQAYVRRTRGDEINAACGQLAHLESRGAPRQTGAGVGVS